MTLSEATKTIEKTSRNLHPSRQITKGVKRKEGYIHYGHPIVRQKKKDRYVMKRVGFDHTIIAGITGTGKSVCVANFAIDNFRNEIGQVVVDIHGDFIDSIIAMTPPDEIHRLGLINPNSRATARINLFDRNCADLQTSIKMVMETLRAASPQKWDELKNVQALLGNSVQLLLYYSALSDQNLFALVRIINNDKLRQSLIDFAKSINNRSMRDCIEYWNFFKFLSKDEQKDLIKEANGYLDRLISVDPMRNCVGMTSSTISLDNYLNGGKTLLVSGINHRNESRFPTSHDANRILIHGLIQKTLAVVQQRQYGYDPENNLLDFFGSITGSDTRPSSAFIVDGFSEFFSEHGSNLKSWLEVMSQNKHEMVLSTQFFAQLLKGKDSQQMVEAIHTNCANKVVFRLNHNKEGTVLAEMLGYPQVTRDDLYHLPSYQAYCSLSVHGEQQPTALVQMSPPAKREWELPQGIGEESTGVNYLPELRWEGMTLATRSSLSQYNHKESSDDGIGKLKHAHALLFHSDNNDEAVQYLVGLSKRDWMNVSGEQRRIDQWQAKTLTQNIHADTESDYVKAVKQILRLRDSIRPTFNEAEIQRQNAY